MKKIVLFLLCCIASVFTYSNSYGQGLCRDTLWNHVYHNYRLAVHDSCMSVSGKVNYLSYEADGDIHIELIVDSPFTYLLNALNYSEEYGSLICEPVCATTVTQTDAIASCLGFTNTVFIPAVGEHVIITGPWVTDNDHGWNELHPVSSIIIGSLNTPAINGATVTPDISVYPNPAKSFVNFTLSKKPSSPVYITISDEIGRSAGQYQMLDMLNLQVNTRYLPSGKYFYNIAQDGRSIKGGTFVLVK